MKNTSIRFFGNDRQFESLRQPWTKGVERVWKSGQYLNGPETRELEEKLKDLTQRKHAILVSSCTDALMIATSYFNVQQVLVTNFSFLASATPILHVNGRPFFCDINSRSYAPSVEDYEVTYKSECIDSIVHVELFGACKNIFEVEEYCKKQRVLLIEDAAQSFGATYKGRSAGSFGSASCLSFDPTKLISGTSPAGCLVTDDDALEEYARAIRLHGRDRQGEFSLLGRKSLVSESEAVILNLKLDNLKGYIRRRREIADFYCQELGGLPLTLPLSESDHVYHKFVVQSEEEHRDRLASHMIERGIEVRIHYPKLLNEEKILQSFNADTPKAKKVSKRCLSLPIYPELTDEEVCVVVGAVKEYFENAK